MANEIKADEQAEKIKGGTKPGKKANPFRRRNEVLGTKKAETGSHMNPFRRNIELRRTDADGQSEERGSANTHVPIDLAANCANLPAEGKMAAALLATASVRFEKEGGITTSCVRALCDTGAQANLITKRSANHLGLRIKRNELLIQGVGQTSVNTVAGITRAYLRSRHDDNVRMEIQLVVVDEITTLMPNLRIRPKLPEQVDEKKLADPAFSWPARIEVLLGAGVWAEIIQDEVVRFAEGLIAQSSALGWLVFGNLRCEAVGEATIATLIADGELAFDLRQMWEVAERRGKADWTAQERWCEENFKATTYRNEEGRYVVRIPIDPANIQLGDSQQIALKRFTMLEKRLERDPALRAKYCEFMEEGIAMGHFRIADRPVLDGGPVCYIPHHPVLQKFRVVFDASCKTSNGLSLNDIQLVGPKLQEDLADLLIGFRQFEFGMTADIKKMYRMIALDPADWDYQRIYWRRTPNGPREELWIVVVIYGEAFSAWVAPRTLIECGENQRKNFPIIADIIRRRFYMDDYLGGAKTIAEGRIIKKDLTTVLDDGGFVLDKWMSNAPELLEGHEESERSLEKGNDTNVLGIVWNSAEDVLKFKINLVEDQPILTKRIITSQAAKVYDPIGFLLPVTIQAKLFIQNLWRVGGEWDDRVPPDVALKWLAYYSELKELRQIAVPRWLGTKDGAKIQFHGFSDASQKAYGAAIYMRVVDEVGHCRVELITAKSRVAPLKIMTLPRLELMAAELLVEIMQRTKEVLELDKAETYYWTDSEIVLFWLRKFPCELKTFVSHRVATIQSGSSVDRWTHIESKMNPADLISRGISVKALVASQLWWHGPEFLAKDRKEWPIWRKGLTVNQLPADKVAQFFAEQPLKERPTITPQITLTTTGKDGIGFAILKRSPTLGSILRVTAYVLRFITKCGAKLSRSGLMKMRGDDTIPTALQISPAERGRALRFWLRMVQRQEYGREIRALEQKEPVEANSKVADLCPFLDDDGIMRLRGRLENAELTFDQKHPIILPAKSIMTERLIAHAHRQTLHGGVQQCTQYLRNQYWILGLRREIKTYISRCIPCFRQRQRTADQLMADLPSCRVQRDKAFRKCGVDYAGPFDIKDKDGRYRHTLKSYAAIFVCLVTRAVHIELVGDLTSKTFLMALGRFLDRRGQVREMWSDNGTVFIGADNELRRIREVWESATVAESLTGRGIVWNFIIPAAPHQGGLWEAAVKSMKHHLRRVMADHVYTFEELYTLLVRIEACLNSRPLRALTDDPKDCVALTPAHFLIGEPTVRMLDEDIREVPANRVKRWQLIQRMEQLFWETWQADYIQGLQRRNKWRTERPNLQVDQLVLIREENLPPTQWRMGRVSKIHPGKDGLVRSATIRTATTELKRPLAKLCILPLPSADDSADDDS